LSRLPELDRAAIRRRFVERFSATADGGRLYRAYGRWVLFPEEAKLGLAAE